MPRYFFHLAMPGELVVDDEGLELTNLDAVREEAIASALAIISDSAREGGNVAGYSFTVTDDHGVQVMVYEFKKLLDGGGTER